MSHLAAVWHDLQFAAPERFWAMLGVLALTAWVAAAEARTAAQLRPWLTWARQPANGLFPSPLALARFLLLSLGLSGVILAWTRPRRPGGEMEQPRSSHRWLILFDLSTSMLAGDVPPSRLGAARRQVRDLLEVMQGDAIGIIGFAASAFIHCPLTVDYSMFEVFLDQLDPRAVAWQGTAIAAAVQLGLNHLESTGSGNTDGSTLLLISDGEDPEGEAAATAQLAVARGVGLHVVGVGTEQGAPLKNADGSFKLNSAGNVVISRLGRDSLRQLAAAAGGQYREMDPAARTLAELVMELRQRAPVFAEQMSQQVVVWQEDYAYPLATGLAALLLAAALPRYRQRHRRVP